MQPELGVDSNQIGQMTLLPFKTDDKDAAPFTKLAISMQADLALQDKSGDIINIHVALADGYHGLLEGS